MSLIWTCESPAFWDADKARVLGETRPGELSLPEYKLGEILPGVWWRVSQSGYVVAYGWMDEVWGEAEILLAVAPEARRLGLGALVLDLLETEASKRGLSYLYNTVSADHPEREQVTRWLLSRGFTHSTDRERLVRCVRQERRLQSAA